MISVSKKLTIGGGQNLVIITVVLLSLVVTRDFIHSSIKNYSFYLYESLLFSTFWLIFIPLTLISKRWAQKKFRIILAILLSALHLSAFSLFVFIVSTLFFDDSFEFYRTLINSTSKYGVFCVLVYGFCSFLFLDDKPVESKEKYQKTAEKIKVPHGNQVVILNCSDIMYVKSEKPYIALITKDRKYLYQSSLKFFLEERASGNFRQIHKSIIVNTDYIVSYTSRKNGDYDIQLTNEHQVRASRSYNKNFKSFFNNIGLE